MRICNAPGAGVLAYFADLFHCLIWYDNEEADCAHDQVSCCYWVDLCLTPALYQRHKYVPWSKSKGKPAPGELPPAKDDK